ncbi:hypothetical protein LRS11_18660 [Pseudomonas sp. J452]|uniref:hypothetical protein n=1 Tax=Pseudomonas sp. J452 TaxID=2898441 RepID=UPI0021ADF549|nr:hypothetical protein [Pseudomonas sp. J452]UUY07809.1 hypothetical protein LRS11_18660 [Pseudomonas sp. J452]
MNTSRAGKRSSQYKIDTRSAETIGVFSRHGEGCRRPEKADQKMIAAKKSGGFVPIRPCTWRNRTLSNRGLFKAEESQ